MVWFRVDCDVGDDELWEDLGSEAGCAGMTALGHYLAFVGRYGERLIRDKIEGRLDLLKDATIEKWANWPGPVGAFAVALRELCTDPDSGELRGFRARNGKLLQNQLTDSGRRPLGHLDSRKPNDPEVPITTLEGRARLETMGNPNGNPAGNANGKPTVDENRDENENKNDNTNTLSSALASVFSTERSELVEAVSVDEYRTRSTLACNRGLRENTRLAGRFVELVPADQDIARIWFEQGIPIRVTEESVYMRARQYVPKGSNLQPRNLNYFRAVVPEAWAHAQHGSQIPRFTQDRPEGVKPSAVRLRKAM